MTRAFLDGLRDGARYGWALGARLFEPLLIAAAVAHMVLSC